MFHRLGEFSNSRNTGTRWKRAHGALQQEGTGWWRTAFCQTSAPKKYSSRVLFCSHKQPIWIVGSSGWAWMTETKSCYKAFHLLFNSCLINLRQGIHKLPIACEVSPTNIPLDHLQGKELSHFQFCLLTLSETYRWHLESLYSGNCNNPLLCRCNLNISKGFLLWGVAKLLFLDRALLIVQ